MKKEEHLPIFGSGPLYVVSIALPTLMAVFFRDHPALESGRRIALQIPRIVLGVLFAMVAFFLWIWAVIVSKPDENIKKNRLVTSGVYAWVRNPVYSAFMLLCTGMLLIVGNARFFALPFYDRALLTVVMKHTEENG